MIDNRLRGWPLEYLICWIWNSALACLPPVQP